MTDFVSASKEGRDLNSSPVQQSGGSHLFESAYDFATKLDKHFNELDINKNGGITKRELESRIRAPLSAEQYNVATTLYAHFDQLTATFTINNQPQPETKRKTVAKLQRLTGKEFCWDEAPSASGVGKGVANGAFAGGILSKSMGGGFREGAGVGAAIGGILAASRYVANEIAGSKITAMQQSIDAWPEFARTSCQTTAKELPTANELASEHHKELQTPLSLRKSYLVGPPKSTAEEKVQTIIRGVGR